MADHAKNPDARTGNDRAHNKGAARRKQDQSHDRAGEPAAGSPASQRIDPDARYWAADVARILFGRSFRWFMRHRKQLHREESFPPPISKIGRPRWSGESLLAWQNRPPAAPNSAPADIADDDKVINIDGRLAQRAAIVARRRHSESV